MSDSKKTIGCVGMTHLGLVYASAFAEKGFHVICYDANEALIQQLRAQVLPVNEPQLDDLVLRNQAALQFTAELEQLARCEVVFIAYDVPTDDKGNSDLTVIHHLLEQVKPVLSSSAALVLLSQLPPGFTRNISFPHDRLFYQVETLVFGRAVERALFPERYIIGADDPKKPLPATYAALLQCFECPILPMRYESAELAKISINLFLVASVATTNTLAEICEKIGADWSDIVPALRLDERIGQHAYLSPGLGIAGGNLERDLNTILQFGKKYHTDTRVVSAWIHNSTHRRDWVLRCLQENVLNQVENPRICILGLAYKPNTHSIKNSPSIALINQLKSYPVQAHDPIVRAHLTHATQYTDVFQAMEHADVVILMLPAAEYRALTVASILECMRGSVIIDPYRVLSHPTIEQDVHYYSLGQAGIRAGQQEKEYA